MKNVFLKLTVPALMGAVLLSGAVGVQAGSILYGVTGDGGGAPETLFELSKLDASSTFVLALGNGDDGEAIGFNPTDGLIYHASGHDSSCAGGGVCFESINSTFTGTTDIDISGGDLIDEEAQALTWDASRGEFLWKQDHGTGPLFSVTAGGAETLIGDMDHQAKGLAFVGSTLYSVDRNSALLRTINSLTAGTISSIGITIAGDIVDGATGLATNPDDNVLWALLKLDSTSGQTRMLATIDESTGIATAIGFTDADSGFAGLAFVIDEPATLALLGLGLLLGGMRPRRRSN